MIISQGIHTVSAEQYHADDLCPTPSLSSSIAKILCTQSPAHAKVAHPKLNPDHANEEKSAFDLGTFLHAALLESDFEAAVIDADSWRTNAAKEERDAARAGGKTPLLTKDFLQAMEMVDAVRAQLPLFDAVPPLLVAGKPEQTLVWQDGDVWCRARIDWLHDDLSAVDDLKSTSRSANPETWARTMFGFGADIQTAFYLRGLKAVTGETPDWRFIVAETTPPYAVSVVSMGPDVLALAEAKVEFAIKAWARCMASGLWPAYPTKVVHAEMPPWEETRWLAHEDLAAA